MKLREYVEMMRRDFLPQLAPGAQSAINSELDCEDDIAMAFDDMLQFSLVSGVPYPPDLLDEAEAIINRGGHDPVLVDRSLGWIKQHRQQAT